jgi:quercetin dioxygenase-like cupin family protein
MHLMDSVNRSSKPVMFTGSTVKVLISGRQSGGQFCMLEFQSPPGRSTPMHSHDREEETIHMLAGVLEVTLGSETVLLNPGCTLLIPRHVAHRLCAQGEESARYIVVCTPAGFDGFVEACASADSESAQTSVPSAADIARLRDQAPRFGITLLPSA